MFTQSLSLCMLNYCYEKSAPAGYISTCTREAEGLYGVQGMNYITVMSALPLEEGKVLLL